MLFSTNGGYNMNEDMNKFDHILKFTSVFYYEMQNYQLERYCALRQLKGRHQIRKYRFGDVRINQLIRIAPQKNLDVSDSSGLHISVPSKEICIKLLQYIINKAMRDTLFSIKQETYKKTAIAISVSYDGRQELIICGEGLENESCVYESMKELPECMKCYLILQGIDL